MLNRYNNTDHKTPPWFPARLNSDEVAKIIGVYPHDIPILVKAKLLIPLGKPAPNAVKYFARVTIERLAMDEVWLGKVTAVLSNYWKGQNDRKRQRADVNQLSA